MARNKVNIFKTMDQFKSGLKSLNETAFELSSEIVDGSLANGAKWQKIMSKAIDNGIDLFGKQQALVLDTLEALKTQYAYGNDRFRKLIDFGSPNAKKETRKAKVKVEKGAKAAQKSPAVKTASAKSDIKKDDLKSINGIGPKTEQLLNEAGIKTFVQLAAAKGKDLQKILDTAGSRFRTHDPADWADQAKKMIKK